MTSQKNVDTALTRRSWMVLATSTLAACGGGGGPGNLTARLPGTGGTGIFQGSISGFGSVIVNGVAYDNSKAIMRMNDVVVSQDVLRLGMVATVQASRVAGTAIGTASSIDVWTIAQGLVSDLDVGAGKFKVAGMTILTSAATWLYAATANTPLANGQYVSVWGLQADEEGEQWTASCVVVSTLATQVVSSGLVKLDDGKRKLNGLKLVGDVASSLADKVPTRVQGVLTPDGSLNVLSAKAINNTLGAQAPAQAPGEVEIEGLVTTAPSASGFMLGSISVQATASMFSPPGAQIGVGSRVEVYGSWQGGVLKATKVELEDASTPGKVKIKAAFQDFQNIGNFVMQGQRCDATGVKLDQKTTAALGRVGTIFKVEGLKNGDLLKVSEMELSD